MNLQCFEFTLETAMWPDWWEVGSRTCNKTQVKLKMLKICLSEEDTYSKHEKLTSLKARGTLQNTQIKLCKFSQ